MSLRSLLAPTRGVTIKGHRLELNEEAMKDAIVRVRDFLRRTIGHQWLRDTNAKRQWWAL